MDYSLLRTIKNLTSHLEVNRCSTGEWERTILQGYYVWRQIKQTGKGTIVGDLSARTIEYRPDHEDKILLRDQRRSSVPGLTQH